MKMEDEQFMNQKAKDMDVEELAKAIKIKIKESIVVSPKKKFPIVFEGVAYNFEVNSGGDIDAYDRLSKKLTISISNSLNMLYEAVKKSKEIRGKK